MTEQIVIQTTGFLGDFTMTLSFVGSFTSIVKTLGKCSTVIQCPNLGLAVQFCAGGQSTPRICHVTWLRRKEDDPCTRKNSSEPFVAERHLSGYLPFDICPF